MALAIFTKTKPAIGTLIADASVREEHSVENEITEEPIEDGTTVNDHILTLPRRITLEIAVTATPDDATIAAISTTIAATILGTLSNVSAVPQGGSFTAGSAAAAAGVGAAALAAAAGIASLIPSLDNTRHKKAWLRLEALAESRTIFDVVTSLRTYRNMAIQRISLPRDSATTNVSYITVECRQIEIAIVDAAANLADQAVDGALGEQDLGSIGTEVVANAA